MNNAHTEEDLIEKLFQAKEHLEVPPAETLGILLQYHPDTGKLFWRDRPRKLCASKRHQQRWADKFAGSEAFTSSNTEGYLQGMVFGRIYTAHRLIWALVYGEWPTGYIHQL